jgi:WD40 repeat protein
VWGIRTGVCQQILKGHSSQVVSVAFVARGSRIFSGSDINACLWNATTGECLRSINLQELEVSRLHSAISGDGSFIVAGGIYGIFGMWNTETGKLIRVLKNADYGEISALTVSEDGVLVVTGNRQSSIAWAWDLSTGGKNIQFNGESTPSINGVAISGNSSRIACSSCHSVCVWDTHTGELISTFKNVGLISFRSLRLNYDGTLLACGCLYGAKVFNVSTGICEQILPATYYVLSVVLRQEYWTRFDSIRSPAFLTSILSSRRNGLMLPSELWEIVFTFLPAGKIFIAYGDNSDIKIG